MSERLVTIGQIIASVEVASGLSRRQILSERRHPDLIHARWAVWWLATHLTPLSLPAIADATNREPSSVLRGIARAKALRAADEVFRTSTDALLGTLSLSERSSNFRLATAADPLAAAVRILRAPEREAVRVSVAEIIAMAQLVVELAEPSEPSPTSPEIHHAA